MTKQKKIIISAILVVAMLLSFFVGGKLASDANNYKKMYSSIDDKKDFVMGLASTSTGLALTIELIANDRADVIAGKLGDLASYLWLILVALYLEKYLLTAIGFLAFRILIPIALAFFIVFVWSESLSVRRVASKLLVFGVALFLIIPSSVAVSNSIDATYLASYEDLIIDEYVTDFEGENAPEENQTVDPSKLPFNPATDPKYGKDEEVQGAVNWFADTWNKFKKDVSESANELVEKLKETGESIGSLTSRAMSWMNKTIEAIAIMIVTSCVIPILTMLLFFWLAKVILGYGTDMNIIKIDRSVLDKSRRGRLPGPDDNHGDLT